MEMLSDKGPFLKNLLGIRHALRQFVQLANPRVTKYLQRRWTGFVVALTVSFTVCDAQQIGLSPSGDLLLTTTLRPAFQMKRPEQKAPQDLGPLPLYNQAFASRVQLNGTTVHPGGLNEFQYALVSAMRWESHFCLRLNSCESPRAPPLMDPPTLC